MSLHRSLKTKPGALNQHRNVLTRAERIARLTDQRRFEPGDTSPLGLGKVTNRAAATSKKKKAAKAEDQEQTAEPGQEKAADEKTASPGK